MLIGKSASQGIAVGRALIIPDHSIKIEEGIAADVDREIKRFQEALNTSRGEIEQLHARVLQTLGDEKAQIFEAHLMILDDPELTDAIQEQIKHHMFKASQAVHEVAQQFITMFQAMDNEYMRERAADIKDVTERILRHLLGIKLPDLGSLQSTYILVASDITPSQMASMDYQKVLGLVTEVGGKTSHTAIMARTLELPAVVGLKAATQAIKNDDLIIIDGEAGEVYCNPSSDTLRIFEDKKHKLDKLKLELKGFVGLPAQTMDGRQVHLEANIASAMDLDAVLRNDAEGVGLFRTEFIYMDRTAAPTEDEQYQIYKTVLERMEQKPTVIRTLDVGGDKNISYLQIPKEDNPFLGFRAIRYCLRNTQVFKAQLRALLRASIHGNLSIMFPMISGLSELQEAKKWLEICKQELSQEGKAFSHSIRVGIMIEIPSAALTAPQLARHCDFFSIGTNDLIQYVCAVDRMNENVHELYDPFHPGVLSLIAQVIKAGAEAGIEVAMCGEMASNELLTQVLLGMGLSHFSMAPSSILRTKKKIRECRFSDAQKLAAAIEHLSSGEEIKQHLMNHK
jgi:phosphoenolpyruvate-protein phosphotransferase (PTS system enzyme I)